MIPRKMSYSSENMSEHLAVEPGAETVDVLKKKHFIPSCFLHPGAVLVALCLRKLKCQAKWAGSKTLYLSRFINFDTDDFHILVIKQFVIYLYNMIVFLLYFFLQNIRKMTGEMSQQLKSFTAIAEFRRSVHTM